MPRLPDTVWRWGATVVTLASWSSPGPAADGVEQPPVLSAWISEVTAGSLAKNPLSRIFIGAKATFDEESLAPETTRQDFAAHAFVAVVDALPWRFAVALNGGPEALEKRHPNDPKAIAVLTNSDLALIVGQKRCQLTDRKRVLGKDTCPKVSQGRELATWLTQKIGYNAVVVAQKGRYLLLEGAAAAIANGTQGLLFADSAKAALLAPGERRGGALLQKVEGSARHGLFAMVLTGKPRDIPQGTKIILDDP